MNNLIDNQKSIPTFLNNSQKRISNYHFYMIMRLLECGYRNKPRLGKCFRKRDEIAIFRQNPSMSFESSMLSHFDVEIDSNDNENITENKKDSYQTKSLPKLYFNFSGLLGANGALPIHFSEFALERLRHFNDSTFISFINIFHHRYYSLLYRAWASSSPVVSIDRPEEDSFARYLKSLLGLSTITHYTQTLNIDSYVEKSIDNHENDRIGDKNIFNVDKSRLGFASRFVSHVRNAEGLVAWVSDFFQLPIQVKPFAGRWYQLKLEEQCCLRSDIRSEKLGVTTIIGSRIWSRQYAFNVLLGPLNFSDFLRMIPGGSSFKSFVSAISDYVGADLAFKINYGIKGKQIPSLQLGKSQLGYTSWLINFQPHIIDWQLKINPVY